MLQVVFLQSQLMEKGVTHASPSLQEGRPKRACELTCRQPSMAEHRAGAFIGREAIASSGSKGTHRNNLYAADLIGRVYDLSSFTGSPGLSASSNCTAVGGVQYPAHRRAPTASTQVQELLDQRTTLAHDLQGAHGCNGGPNACHPYHDGLAQEGTIR